jgi:hypothetical protein
MPRAILILDTSVLCCWLQVVGKEEAGAVEDRWTHQRIDALLQKSEKEGATLVLPIATLIETGNHIAQAPSQRYECAQRLGHCLQLTVNAESPWAAFVDQDVLWKPENLQKLATEWPTLAASRLSMGDATIKDIAEFYAEKGFEVSILTGDQGLKAYQPVNQPSVPRRRR